MKASWLRDFRVNDPATYWRCRAVGCWLLAIPWLLCLLVAYCLLAAWPQLAHATSPVHSQGAASAALPTSQLDCVKPPGPVQRIRKGTAASAARPPGPGNVEQTVAVSIERDWACAPQAAASSSAEVLRLADELRENALSNAEQRQTRRSRLRWATALLALLLLPFAIWGLRRAYRYHLLSQAGWRSMTSARAVRSGEVDSNVLMPSQQTFVNQFIEDLEATDRHTLSAKIYALRGRWGSGKSTLVQALFATLAGRVPNGAGKTGFIPVYMNAWREETPDDLHFRLVEHLALHPDIFSHCSSLFTLRFLGGLARGHLTHRRWPTLAHVSARLRTKLPANDSDVETQATWQHPTPLNFQEDLDRMIFALRSKNIHVVLFVDELERGTRAAAQALVVLLRRSFDMPGLHLVVPFVPEVMDAMVFNPVNQVALELRSASSAVLYTHEPAREKAYAAANAFLQRQRAHDDQTLTAAALPIVSTAVRPGATGQTDGGSVAPQKAMPTLEQRFDDELLSQFLKLDASQRRPLQQRLQEKYFGFAREVPAVTAADFAHLILHRAWFFVGDAGQPVAGRGTAVLSYLQEFSPAGVPAQQWAADEVKKYFDSNRQASKAQLELELGRQLFAQTELLAATQPGQFSIRSFDGHLRILLDRFNGAPLRAQSAARNMKDDMGAVDPTELPALLITQFLAQWVLLAIALVHRELLAPIQLQASAQTSATPSTS